jgi:hypothetical protein
MTFPVRSDGFAFYNKQLYSIRRKTIGGHMNTGIPQSPSFNPAGPKYPWDEKEQNGCVYGLEVFGFIVLIMSGLGGLITAIVFLQELNSPTNNTILTIIVSIVILAGSIVGMIFLVKPMKIPAAYKPRAQYVFQPTVLGQPFDVRFKPVQQVQPVGIVQFTEQAIHVEGVQQGKSCWLFLLGWLLYSLFNKKFNLDFLYSQLVTMSCTGKTVTLNFSAGEPNQFVFRVSMLDGERLYRELLYHFPQQMEQYRDVILGKQ